jgi:hypothetical protein
MTAYATTLRLGTALVLAALLVLAVAPAAMAQDATRGWERTGVSTGQSYDNGQAARAAGGSAATQETVGARGWEATSTAGGTTASASNDDRPVSATPQSPSISPTMLSLLALFAGAIVAFGAVRIIRPRPHRVA